MDPEIENDNKVFAIAVKFIFSTGRFGSFTGPMVAVGLFRKQIYTSKNSFIAHRK